MMTAVTKIQDRIQELNGSNPERAQGLADALGLMMTAVVEDSAQS